MSVQVKEQQRSIWDTPLTVLVQVNWEIVLLVALIAVAAVTRFYDLGSAAWSHDEAIHTNNSFELYTGRGYIHNPIYHGPLLYHLTALTYFILGDNNFSARAMPVLFGLVLIALPYFFREWLGKRGWFVTALLLFISPVVAHYSRVDRHDIYVEVFVVLMVLTIFKYLNTRNERWLYFGSAVLALSFTAMETTFIFTALFAYFLTALFTYQWFHRRAPDDRLKNGLIAAFLGLPFTAAAVVMFLLERFGVWRDKKASAEESAFNLPAFDLIMVIGTLILPLAATPLFIKYILQRDPTDYSSVFSISASGISLLFFIILSAALGAAWNWRRWIICAVWFYPIMVIFFTTVFTNPAGIGSGFVGSLGYWITQQPVQRGNQPQYYYLMVTLPEYEFLPYLFGMLGLFYIVWRRARRRAAIFGAVLLALVAIEALIWFTPDVLNGMIASLPFFRGRDALQAANFTVLILGLLAPVFFALAFDPDDRTTWFPTLLGIWTIGCMVLFSWAGEKMPWLTMHMAIPLSFVAGYFMNDVLNADWRDLYRRGALLLALAFTIGLLVLAFQVFFGPAPLSGTPLDQQARIASSIVAILIVGICAGAVFYVGMALGAKTALRVVAVTVFAILALFTVRTMASAAYYNKDMATETIVYAQGTPDVPNAVQEIEELSRRLCSQPQTDVRTPIHCENGTIKVAYDDDSSWPLVWYLRNFRNQQFYGSSPGGPFDAEVVIAGDKNDTAIKPFVGNRYYKRAMRLVWWPDEGYKGLDWTKLFGGTDQDGNHIAGVLEPENLKSLVRDIWFLRKYSTGLSEWPLVHRFYMYVRKDIANQLWQYAGVVPPTATNPEDDPYVKNYIQGLAATAAIDSANGPLNSPKNLALDSQGNSYVLDTNNHRLLKYDAARNLVKQWGGQGAERGQFNEPWGIAIGKDDTIFVADTWNHRIEKFDKDGNFITEWGTFGDIGTDPNGDALQLYGPRSLAIDADGNLWVTDTGNERVIKYDPNGQSLGTFGGTGSEIGQFLEPVGIAIDKDGNIYVADTWNRRIQKFDKNFAPLQQWDVEAWDSQSVVNKPYLAVDAQGNVYASDPEGYRILKFGSDGKLRAVWGTPGDNLGGVQLPTGLVVDNEGQIWIADSGNNRVVTYPPVTK